MLCIDLMVMDGVLESHAVCSLGGERAGLGKENFVLEY